MSAKVASGAVLSLWLLSISNCMACSCPVIEIEQSTKSYDQILFAVIKSARVVPKNGASQAYVEGLVDVEKVFKGNVNRKNIKITTPIDSSSCGIQLVVPAKYVLFLSQGSNSVVSCSGSAPLNSLVQFRDAEELASRITNAIQSNDRARR